MTEPDQPLIELLDVSVVRGGQTIWTQGSFAIPVGAFAAVIGPNGSGKTTFLQLVLGLLPPATGSLRILGKAPQRGDAGIGYVPQNYNSTNGDAVRARDLVTLGLSGGKWGIHRTTAAEVSKVDAALEAVGALEFSDRRMSELSGGQQQRVAIAQAVVSEPRLLLLDEPLANLDVKNQHEIVNLLSELRGRLNLSVVVVVHDLNPLLSKLTSAVYLLDGHAHYASVDEVVDQELLTHLYGTEMLVVRTPQGDLYTRSA